MHLCYNNLYSSEVLQIVIVMPDKMSDTGSNRRADVAERHVMTWLDKIPALVR